MAQAETATSKVRYPDFAARMQTAILQHPRIPDGHGRLAYITREWKTLFGEDIQREQIRRWVKGESEPRAENRAKLAEILGVTTDWLMSSVASDSPAAGSSSNAGADLIMGMMRMHGWDVRPDIRKDIDFVARLRGRTYMVQVKTGKPDAEGVAQFKMPKSVEGKIVLGVLPGAGTQVDIFEIIAEPGAEVSVERKGGKLMSSGNAQISIVEGFDRPL